MNQLEVQQDSWRAGLGTNQAKALSLLGQGISSVMVASTLGVSESLISQFLSDSRFAEEVVKLKLATLQKQTSIDNKHMEIEDKLLDKLAKVIPLMSKPMDILRGIQVINATKRRGMAEAGPGLATSTIVNINLPAAVHAKFVTNTHNQIVEVQDGEGSRSLVTASTQTVERLAADRKAAHLGEIEDASFTTVASIGDSEITSLAGWEANTSSADLLRQASERVEESSVSETVSKGLRRSFETKGAITINDL